ncbi:response regulator transcription factor [Rhizobium leucaenae]|uniref:FixJ family two-component response regulator n=1 Tax=Rhizobium leucaenae TaxID=29450 RepID=A0A7W6ZZ78_9HYPH|nr:response regulator [Rhizobium leucaenae]MBB4571421.1 FixJ family two-component response regulator [Rhizobium leucaenae]MBB6305502.1 FixJ family two-component response regulator [Rhizobium leucaenae]
MTKVPLISPVDGDEAVRESLPDLIRSLGVDIRTYPSKREFLSCASRVETACLLLDVAMPDMSGPELPSELARRGETVPIAFITAQHDDDRKRALLQRGAIDCLFKPFNDEDLRDALDRAIA